MLPQVLKAAGLTQPVRLHWVGIETILINSLSFLLFTTAWEISLGQQKALVKATGEWTLLWGV